MILLGPQDFFLFQQHPDKKERSGSVFFSQKAPPGAMYYDYGLLGVNGFQSISSPPVRTSRSIGLSLPDSFSCSIFCFFILRLHRVVGPMRSMHGTTTIGINITHKKARLASSLRREGMGVDNRSRLKQDWCNEEDRIDYSRYKKKKKKKK